MCCRSCQKWLFLCCVFSLLCTACVIMELQETQHLNENHTTGYWCKLRLDDITADRVVCKTQIFLNEVSYL